MQTKRLRSKRKDGLTDTEPEPKALDALPQSDEDPVVFWGPDWHERLDEALADVAAGHGTVYESSEAFLASLDQRSASTPTRSTRRRRRVSRRDVADKIVAPTTNA